MERTINREHAIKTIRVFTEGNQVFTGYGRKKAFQLPLRWVNVHISAS